MSNREFGWDETIENDGTDFILLPKGIYPFKVETFERARFGGSAKMSACNQAILHIEIAAPDGSVVTLKHNLFLHSKCEWMLCQFFRSIGQREHGEQFRMDWNSVPQATGVCEIRVKKFISNKTKEELEANEIVKFLDASDLEKLDKAAPEKDDTPDFEGGEF